MKKQLKPLSISKVLRTITKVESYRSRESYKTAKAVANEYAKRAGVSV
jgi:hypothetical protein